MNALTLYSKIEMLPEHLKRQVIDYVEFLLSRQTMGANFKPPTNTKQKFEPGFGGAKGMIKLKPGWDEPLEDFQEYR